MSILELLFLSKSESFEGFMRRIESIFKNVNLGALLNGQVMAMQHILPNFMNKDTNIKQSYVHTCCNLINCGINKAQGKAFKMDYNLQDINKYLSFDNLAMADERLLSGFYLQSNFVFTLLQLAFFALVYIDDKTRKRFELAYTLWWNATEFSFAGYDEESNKMLSYYITFFNSGIFLINPKEGKVYRFIKNGALRNVDIKVLVKDKYEEMNFIYAITSEGERVPLVKYGLSGYENIVDMEYACSNVRRSEQVRTGTYGTSPDWMTAVIGTYPAENGILSNYSLREHLFVALMVYGIESMKFAIMNGNSILTIDHNDGIHSNNSIENLKLLTRHQNIQKEYNQKDFYFDFFEFFNKSLEAAKRIQDDYDFRKRCSNV